jgi:hypothetical protein
MKIEKLIVEKLKAKFPDDDYYAFTGKGSYYEDLLIKNYTDLTRFTDIPYDEMVIKKENPRLFRSYSSPVVGLSTLESDINLLFGYVKAAGLKVCLKDDL